MREAGFRQDTNDDDEPTTHRWRIDEGATVLLDFLIQPPNYRAEAGKPFNLEKDWAATVTPGLDLAFKQRERVLLAGRTIKNEKASEEVWVAGAGAFLILKALAFGDRGMNKDAYDLYYLLQTYGDSVDDVVEAVRPLARDAHAEMAFQVLERKFTDVEHTGPMRAAEFLGNVQNDAVKMDLVSAVGQVLKLR